MRSHSNRLTVSHEKKFSPAASCFVHTVRYYSVFFCKTHNFFYHSVYMVQLVLGLILSHLKKLKKIAKSSLKLVILRMSVNFLHDAKSALFQMHLIP
jgi:hypothetical protein